MKKKYKILVAHPGKQHSFRLASALKKENLLFKYCTTVYAKEGSYTYRILNTLGENDKNKALSRRNIELNDNEVEQFYEISGLIGIVLNRFHKLLNIYRKWNKKLIDKFGKKVAKFAIENNVDAVIMYDSTATRCFEILKEKAPNIIRIMDVSIATRHFMKNVFEEDMKKTNSDEFKKEYKYLWNDKEMHDYKKEIELSDYFLVPSNIVKESLLYCGANENQIHIIPYGVDITKFDFKLNNKRYNNKINLIYVGQISHRKGIHHLLKVVSKFDESLINLTLIGGYNKESLLYKEYVNYDNINFGGFVNHDKLKDLYKDSDIFVFPTLGEGYGLVVLEAMSSGLPILCSSNAGGNDAIVEGYNGFVFEAGNDSELRDRIEWFIKNKDQIPKMSINARKTAERYTWKQYEINLCNEIKNIISQNKK